MALSRHMSEVIGPEPMTYLKDLREAEVIRKVLDSRIILNPANVYSYCRKAVQKSVSMSL